MCDTTKRYESIARSFVEPIRCRDRKLRISSCSIWIGSRLKRRKGCWSPVVHSQRLFTCIAIIGIDFESVSVGFIIESKMTVSSHRLHISDVGQTNLEFVWL